MFFTTFSYKAMKAQSFFIFKQQMEIMQLSKQSSTAWIHGLLDYP